MPLLRDLLLVASFALLVVGQATVNVTYTDPRITYSGAWSDFTQTSTGCTWRSTVAVGASASFTFRGTAVSIFGDHFDVVPAVRVDGLPREVGNAVGGARCDELVYQQTGLTDGEHTIEFILTSVTRPGGRLELSSFFYTEGTAPTPVPTTSTTVSSTPSSASSSPSSVSSSTPATSTTSAAPASTPTTSAETSKAPNRRLSSGGIVGVAIGAVAALGLAVLAFLGSDQIAHVLEALLASWFAWKCHRMIFKAPRSLGQTQISLFLTSDQVLADVDDADMDKPLVWQVFNIGGAKREFTVDIPAVPGTGNVKLGYATIDDSDSNVPVVQCRTAEKAPARLIDGDAWEHEGEPQASKPAKKDPKAPGPKLTATNGNDHGVRIALGTYDDENAKVQPLLLVEQLPGGGVYEAPDDLYLHAFRSNGYTSGQYGKTLFKDVVGDRLTPEEGFKLSKLSPLTTWYIKSDRDGKLTLKIGRNSRKDVKAYRHECKIGKDAIAKV